MSNVKFSRDNYFSFDKIPPSIVLLSYLVFTDNAHNLYEWTHEEFTINNGLISIIPILSYIII